MTVAKFLILAIWTAAPMLLAQSHPPVSAQNDPPPQESSLLTNAVRAIVVVAPDWNAVDGTLTRYFRSDGQWKQVGEQVPVVVGKNGLAWDPNIANGHVDEFPGPVKHEGDGRAPAGIFKLSDSFGFAESPSDIQNYMPLSSTTECVDDLNSRHYGQIVDRTFFEEADWNSSEKMRDIDLYRWGVVVSYNMEHPVPGNGSCIFLHIWRGPKQGTAGCTAMPEENLLQIIHWINSKAPRAVLIQLPQTEYQRLKEAWGLP